MGGTPEARKIARIGLIVECEDGGKIMIYADQLTHAEVTVTTEARQVPVYWGGDVIRRGLGGLETSILIEGLEAYTVAETMPAMATHMLEALKDGIAQ